MGRNVAGREAFTGFVALVLDLILGVRDEALDRAASGRRSSPRPLERLRGEDPPDEKGDTGRSISVRRLSLATLKVVVELRGSGWTLRLESSSSETLGDGSGESSLDFDFKIGAGLGPTGLGRAGRRSPWSTVDFLRS